MTKLTGLIALIIVAACGHARAQDDPFWDEWARYLQRIDTVSVTSGNARNVNAVTQIIDPWPYYVGNRRIPANGQRMVGAIERYQNRGKPAAAGGGSSGAAGNVGGGGDGGGGGMGGGGGGGY
jgi:uncharacterized membrane protein YgcG